MRPGLLRPSRVSRSACRIGRRDFREANSRSRVGPWRISLLRLATFCVSIILFGGMRQDCCQKLNILAATLVHFHRFICTTNMRADMTQIQFDIRYSSRSELNRCSHTRGFNDPLGNGIPPRNVGFRHICARYCNYRTASSSTPFAEISLMKLQVCHSPGSRRAALISPDALAQSARNTKHGRGPCAGPTACRKRWCIA